MTFSIHQGGVVMSSQIMVTQSTNTHHLAHAYTIGTCASFLVVVPVLQFTKPHQVTASHPSPGDNPIEHGRAVRKNAGSCKYGGVELNHLRIHQGSPHLPICRALLRNIHAPLSLCCSRPSSSHPSNRTSVYPVLAIHILPPSTRF